MTDDDAGGGGKKWRFLAHLFVIQDIISNWIFRVFKFWFLYELIYELNKLKITFTVYTPSLTNIFLTIIYLSIIMKLGKKWGCVNYYFTPNRSIGLYFVYKILAVSRTYPQSAKPVVFRTFSAFAQFGASRTILHNFKYKNNNLSKIWVQFRQKLGSV